MFCILVFNVWEVLFREVLKRRQILLEHMVYYLMQQICSVPLSQLWPICLLLSIYIIILILSIKWMVVGCWIWSCWSVNTTLCWFLWFQLIMNDIMDIWLNPRKSLSVAFVTGNFLFTINACFRWEASSTLVF